MYWSVVAKYLTYGVLAAAVFFIGACVYVYFDNVRSNHERDTKV